MLQPLPYEMSPLWLPDPSLRTVDYLDTMIAREQLDKAKIGLNEYLDTLFPQSESGEYNRDFYRVAIKEIALPMYRKYRADRRGEPYPTSRQDIQGMYEQASALMSILLESKSDKYKRVKYDERLDQTHLRGDLSELTVFALASRSLEGVGDDYTIMPSAVAGDLGTIDKQGQHSGYDFIVHGRDTDEVAFLQVKTSRANYKYQPNVAVFILKDFADSMHISIDELQYLIANDSDRQTPELGAADHTMRLYLDGLNHHYGRAA